MGNFGYGTPILPTMLLSQGSPQFSGMPEDWRDFSRDFQEYLDTACVGSQGVVTDQQHLKLLGFCLDKRTQKHLRTKRDLNPDLTFEEYWRELNALYGGDVDGNRRRAWENVSLDGAKELDPQTLRAFQTDVEAAVARDPSCRTMKSNKKNCP